MASSSELSAGRRRGQRRPGRVAGRALSKLAVRRGAERGLRGDSEAPPRPSGRRGAGERSRFLQFFEACGVTQVLRGSGLPISFGFRSGVSGGADSRIRDAGALRGGGVEDFVSGWFCRMLSGICWVDSRSAGSGCGRSRGDWPFDSGRAGFGMLTAFGPSACRSRVVAGWAG